MTPLIVALAGVALLVVLAIGVAWQERRRPMEPGLVYDVEESIAFVHGRLGAAAASVLKPSDVRRMLEWSVRYLQDPAVRESPNAPAVAGGEDIARYVQERSIESGVAYDAELIFEVLDLQNRYLQSLGALGDHVDGREDGGR